MNRFRLSLLLLWQVLLSIAVPSAQAACQNGFQELPQNLTAIKEAVILLGKENLDNWGDNTIQETVETYASQLEEWYVDHRPLDEVELERGAWRLAWFWPYPPFDFNITNFVFALDRSVGYQIITDRQRGRIGNIAKYDVGFCPFCFSITWYVIEWADLVNPHTDDNTCGQEELNQWDIEFRLFRWWIEFGWIGTSSKDFDDIYYEMLDVERPLQIPLPFPPQDGLGFDWVRYMDNDIRIVQHVSQTHVYVRDDDGDPNNDYDSTLEVSVRN